jgi:hypothetical protein
MHSVLIVFSPRASRLGDPSGDGSQEVAKGTRLSNSILRFSDAPLGSREKPGANRAGTHERRQRVASKGPSGRPAGRPHAYSARGWWCQPRASFSSEDECSRGPHCLSGRRPAAPRRDAEWKRARPRAPALAPVTSDHIGHARSQRAVEIWSEEPEVRERDGEERWMSTSGSDVCATGLTNAICE